MSGGEQSNEFTALLHGEELVQRYQPISPDTTLSAYEREIGGLGIFMVDIRVFGGNEPSDSEKELGIVSLKGERMNKTDKIFKTKAVIRLKKIFCLALSFVFICLLLAGCGKDGSEAVTDIRQLDGQAIGVMSGSSFDVHTDNLIKDAEKQYYDRVTDLALAVEQGKIAAFLMDEPIARLLCKQNRAVTYLPEVLVQESYAAAFSKTRRGAEG